MSVKHLQPAAIETTAHFSVGVPTKLALKAGVLSVVIVLTLALLGCKDSPAFTKEEMQSDSLPEFDDSVITGQWLLGGELAVFEAREHGVYVLREVKEDTSSPTEEEEITFTLKRLDNLLFMEYSAAEHGARYYRPCWIGVTGAALEFHCLEQDYLSDFGVKMETRKVEDSEFQVITDTQEHLRQVYLEQAGNKNVFEPTMRMTRPQPERIARTRKQAVAGKPEAQERLAKYLDSGEFVVRDRDEAVLWACKAADSGRASAQVLCGSLLEQQAAGMFDSDGLREQAKTWYVRAAEQNYPEAFSKLGVMYQKNVVGDDAAAVQMLKRGAELGDPESHVQLGFRYSEGRGVLLDERLAKWHLEQVPESVRSGIVWGTLAEIYLHSTNPDLRDKVKALHAGEMAIQDYGSPDQYALAAEAAYENDRYSLAAKYQKDALIEGGADQRERLMKLEMYRALALVEQH